MRVVEFRAWDIDKQKYITWFEIGCEGCVTTQEPNCSPDYPNVILEQYTGLKDKNGKEIYEGDIVRCYSRRKLLGDYQVIWNEDCGGFECESLKPLVDGGGRMLKDVRVFNEISIQFRVIGNIHENKELLKEKKEC